jgi:hypothetical protein
MPRPDATVVRAVVAAAALALLAAAAGGPMLAGLLPLHRWMLALLGPEFRLLRLSVDGTGAGSMLRAWADLDVPLRIGGQWLQPLGWEARGNGWIEATLTAAGALQSTLVLMVAACAWPSATRSEAARRAVLAVLTAIVLTAIEPPLTLLADLRRALYADPDTAGDPLIAIGRFLQGGGSAAIGLAAACIVIAACRPGTRASG